MLKLGTATAIITPTEWEQVTMNGMPRLIPNQGVLDDLQADVFVLQDGGNTVVICTLDQVFVTHDDQSNIEARLKLRLPGAHLIICSTHNHSSTAIPFGQKSEQAEANCAAAREIMYQGFSTALNQALQDMREVEVAARRIPLPMQLGLNRRGKLSNGGCTQAWGAGPLIPPGHKCVGKSGGDATWIDVLAFREPGATEPHALLSSYPSHIHLYEVPLFTGEVAGGARMSMRQRHPGIHLMYSIGIAGDVAQQFAHPIPVDDEPSRIAWQKEKTAAFGAAFSQVLSDSLQGLRYSSVDMIQYACHHEPGKRQEECLLVQSLRLGPHALCSLPGEMFIEWDGHLRRDMSCETLLPMTYNCSNLGYIPTQLGFEEGSYEAMRGPVEKMVPEETAGQKGSPNTGEIIVEKARKQLASLFGR